MWLTDASPGPQERKMSELAARPWVGAFLSVSEPWAQNRAASPCYRSYLPNVGWDDGFWVSCAVFHQSSGRLPHHLPCVFQTGIFFFSLWHHLKLEPWFLPHGRMIQTTTAAFLNYLNSFIRDHLPSGYLKEPEEIFKIWNVENVLGKPTYVYFLGSLRQKYQCEPSRIMLSFPRVWPLLKSKR